MFTVSRRKWIVSHSRAVVSTAHERLGQSFNRNTVQRTASKAAVSAQADRWAGILQALTGQLALLRYYLNDFAFHRQPEAYVGGPIRVRLRLTV